MAKDTFYFSHDFNARSDDKIKKLIRKHGMRGYGIFWAIVEDLYNNANALLLDCEGIAYDMREDCELVKSVIHDFGFFVVEGDMFGSISIGNRLCERNAKSKKARENAHKRWGKTNNNATAMQTHSDSNAINKTNEFKQNEEDETQNSPHFISQESKDQFIGIPIDECRVKYDLECQAQKESICMNQRIKKDQIGLIQDSFDATLKSKVKTKAFDDYRNHFANWVGKLPLERIKEITNGGSVNNSGGIKLTTNIPIN